MKEETIEERIKVVVVGCCMSGAAAECRSSPLFTQSLRGLGLEDNINGLLLRRRRLDKTKKRRKKKRKKRCRAFDLL